MTGKQQATRQRMRTGPRCTHQGNQHKDQLTGVHVTEQPHAVRNCFSGELDHLHQEVDRRQHRVRAKRGCKQLMHPTADTLDFDVVVQTDNQHAQRHGQRDVQVSRRHNTQERVMRVMPRSFVIGRPDLRKQIQWQQIHGIQEEDPNEYGQRQRCNEQAGLGVVNNAFGLVGNHLHQHFNG